MVILIEAHEYLQTQQIFLASNSRSLVCLFWINKRRYCEAFFCALLIYTGVGLDVF